MGTPVTEKISDDGLNENLTFGSSSMQGWRRTQERRKHSVLSVEHGHVIDDLHFIFIVKDAHNCCVNFGKNSSFFAVYDGHCGAEVALYCAKKLPDFLKSVEAYENGDFEQALKDAFNGFDSTLTDVSVVAELEKLVINAMDRRSALEDNGDDEEVDLSTEQDLSGSDVMDTSNESKTNPVIEKESGTKLPFPVHQSSPDADSSLDNDDEDLDLETSSYDDEADDEADDEEYFEEDDSDHITSRFFDNMIDTPGHISGCTAVVALLVDRELYVANAGDSRCVLCRNGKTVEMSIDHKPDDDGELLRITKAGGHVTKDGRLNGGLNLSRAIGDHAYKMNKDVKPEEQMISAMPDIRKVTVADDDEFMVLASDGVWNCMSSEEVVEFVRKRLTERRQKISSICEELFNKCLEPDADDEVTGCDNMTAIIVQFQQNLQQSDNKAPTTYVKRAATPTFVSTGNEVHKRFKSNDEDNV